jgi:hypothetical protein
VTQDCCQIVPKIIQVRSFCIDHLDEGTEECATIAEQEHEADQTELRNLKRRIKKRNASDTESGARAGWFDWTLHRGCNLDDRVESSAWKLGMPNLTP